MVQINYNKTLVYHKKERNFRPRCVCGTRSQPYKQIPEYSTPIRSRHSLVRSSNHKLEQVESNQLRWVTQPAVMPAWSRTLQIPIFKSETYDRTIGPNRRQSILKPLEKNRLRLGGEHDYTPLKIFTHRYFYRFQTKDIFMGGEGVIRINRFGHTQTHNRRARIYRFNAVLRVGNIIREWECFDLSTTNDKGFNNKPVNSQKKSVSTTGSQLSVFGSVGNRSAGWLTSTTTKRWRV